MNLMGTKPSFWSGQAAHMADTGQVLSGLSQAPSWPCSIKSGRRLQAGSQRCWQVFIRLLGVMWPSVLWVPHPSTWAMALMARRQVWAHAALLLPFPQIPLRRAAKLPLLSGLPLLHYKMSSAHLLASEASWESMGAFPPHPHLHFLLLSMVHKLLQSEMALYFCFAQSQEGTPQESMFHNQLVPLM